MRLSFGIVLSGKMSSTIRYIHVQRVCWLDRVEFLQLNGLYHLYGVDEHWAIERSSRESNWSWSVVGYSRTEDLCIHRRRSLSFVFVLDNCLRYLYTATIRSFFERLLKCTLPTYWKNRYRYAVSVRVSVKLSGFDQ